MRRLYWTPEVLTFVTHLPCRQDAHEANLGLFDGTVPHQKSRTSIGPGMRLHMVYAGGGGYGNPVKRDRASVRDDVKNGYVSAKAAKRDYGLS